MQVSDGCQHVRNKAGTEALLETFTTMIGQHFKQLSTVTKIHYKHELPFPEEHFPQPNNVWVIAVRPVKKRNRSDKGAVPFTKNNDFGVKLV
jgi:RNA-splicing ligase RtcB